MCPVVSKKDIPICELRIADIEIKQVQHFKHLGSVLTNGGNMTPKSEGVLK